MSEICDNQAFVNFLKRQFQFLTAEIANPSRFRNSKNVENKSRSIRLNYRRWVKAMFIAIDCVFHTRYFSTEIEPAARTHTRDLMSEHLKSTLKFQHSTSTENSIKHYHRF